MERNCWAADTEGGSFTAWMAGTVVPSPVIAIFRYFSARFRYYLRGRSLDGCWCFTRRVKHQSSLGRLATGGSEKLSGTDFALDWVIDRKSTRLNSSHL